MAPVASLSSALAEFLRLQESVPDPRLHVWARPESPGDARLAVLASCIGQDLTIPAAARLVRELAERLGPDLLAPWRLRSESLGAACRLPWLSAWPHREHLPGWVSAVGDLLREHPEPARWASTWPRPRDFVRTLALGLPWMGRKSPDRVKAWRLVRWLVRGEGLATPLWPEPAIAELQVPPPVLATPLGWFERLPPGWDSWNQARRSEWTDSVCRDASPGDPAALWVPLESILRRGSRDHLCAERVGGCPSCPLRAPCKGDASPSRSRTR